LKLIKELHRRNVFRVAVGYIISCWILAQAADLLLDIIGSPDWVLRTIALVLALGFPFVLFFSWAYELTPDGLKREAEVDPARSLSYVTGGKMDVVIFTMLVIALGYFVWESRFSEKMGSPVRETPARSVATENNSIAVLPFINRSARAEDQFFTDGIHDNLLTNLAKVGSLKVISNTSVMRYRESSLSIPQIAEELGVTTVLEGAVQRSADQVRITVQLINAKTDGHLWAENYDRELSAENLFTIQSEITHKIVAALKATLSGQETKRVDTAPTRNLEAYGEYVLGRQEIAKRTIVALNRARVHFENAVELDPEYVLAYVGIADALNLLTTYGNVNPAELNAPRQRAIDRALLLDPDSGEAYTSLAALRVDQFEEQEAERFFKKAIKLSPNYSTAYHWYSYLLLNMGRFAEALPPIHKALELDPMASILTTQYARVLWNLGQVEEAMAALTEGVRRNFHFPNHYVNMAANLRELGQLGESMHWLYASLQLDATSAFARIAFCKRYLDFGDDQEAERCFDVAERTYPGPSIGSRVELEQYRFRFPQALEQALKLDQRFPLAFSKISLGWNYINNEQYDRTLAIVNENWPQMLTGDRIVFNNSDELSGAVLAGYALYATGQKERANSVLDQALDYMKTIDRVRGDGYSELDVIIHVLRGDKQKAVLALREAVDAGWRDNWWRLRYPFFEVMLDEPEWVELMTEIEADIALQMQWFEDHKDSPVLPALES
jgi:TolB-like protein/Tfp pilus assembly protein PilF